MQPSILSVRIRLQSLGHLQVRDRLRVLDPRVRLSFLQEKCRIDFRTYPVREHAAFASGWSPRDRRRPTPGAQAPNATDFLADA